MKSEPLSRALPLRLSEVLGAHADHGFRRSAQASAQAAGASPRAAFRDEVRFSAPSQSLNRLLRLWGSLSSLFGNQGSQPNAGPDFSGLLKALETARRNAEESQKRQAVLDTLKTSVLRQAELLVEQYYGLRGDGAPLRVVLEENMGSTLASVNFRYDSRGRMADQQLHVSLAAFQPDAGPNGVNDHTIENDRILAHEMTHAVMGRNMDVSALPEWFVEGTAEYIAGGAERVKKVLNRMSAGALLNRVLHPWESDSTQYAAGYLAVRYMDQATESGGGLKAIMGKLKAGLSLDEALADVSGGEYGNVRTFLERFARGGEGFAFLQTIDLSGRDPGSIKPGRGPDIVPDQGTRSAQPLRGFRIEWPSPLEGLAVSGPLPLFGRTPARATADAYWRNMR